jgi:hypothetical protein
VTSLFVEQFEMPASACEAIASGFDAGPVDRPT